MNTLYTKDGTTRAKNRIVIVKNNKQIINPSHEMLLADGWEPYVEQGATLDDIKAGKIAEINVYDTSAAVNSFWLNGNAVWLDKADRVGLMNSIGIEKSAGREVSTLWFGGVKLEVNCDTAIQLLSALELYALECYNVTASHKAAVMSFTDMEEVEKYDYTTGYPEKLNIEL